MLFRSKQLVDFKPITPLTGEADEWRDGTGGDGDGILQNKRMPSVFWSSGIGAYWIEGKIFQTPDGLRYTSSDSWVPISFPFKVREPEIVNVDE